MRLLNFWVAAICATAAWAQSNNVTSEEDADAAALPSCGYNCLSVGITDAGCGLTDWDCICGPGLDTVRANSITCIISTCSTADALKTQQLALALCDLATNSSITPPTYSTTGAATATTPPSTGTRGSSSPTPTSFSTTLTSTVVSTSTVLAPTSSSTTVSSSVPAKSGLSRKDIVGIAVGSVFGGLFLITIVVLAVFGSRKRRRDLKHLAAMAAVDNRPVVALPPGPSELSGTSYVHEAPNSEVGIGMALSKNSPVEAVSPLSPMSPMSPG